MTSSPPPPLSTPTDDETFSPPPPPPPSPSLLLACPDTAGLDFAGAPIPLEVEEAVLWPPTAALVAVLWCSCRW